MDKQIAIEHHSNSSWLSFKSRFGVPILKHNPMSQNYGYPICKEQHLHLFGSTSVSELDHLAETISQRIPPSGSFFQTDSTRCSKIGLTKTYRAFHSHGVSPSYHSLFMGFSRTKTIQPALGVSPMAMESPPSLAAGLSTRASMGLSVRTTYRLLAPEWASGRRLSSPPGAGGHFSQGTDQSLVQKRPSLHHFMLLRCCDRYWLVVGPPLWKIWKSIGMISNPIYGKIKLMFQTTNQDI